MLFYLEENVKKIKVNLYISTRKVKTVKINEPDNWDLILKRDYKVTIIGQKDIFGKHIVTTILRPVTLLMDPTDKEVDLNCVVYGGANIE